ncbi:polysaccharide pyruvyl transferase CsaB [Paenibacillus psychroresistens]|uniref:polysaccharide pyruvyl transferase CsaB n=1 Tax=Paenibacillus psychroresistens TaxID=1778678 RepID=UPI00187897AF|nr:polysaccharide pyruvyl transferase CsaB [Paenibacillus psychroresistens]
MGSSTKRIIISGYYGFKNSGDEAVLQSILLALAAESVKQGITIEPIVLSIDPERTSRTYGVQSVHRMRLAPVLKAIRQSHGLISGGGSLLQDATGRKSIPYYLGIIKLAQWLGKPTFIYAQGVGPVQSKTFHPFIRSIFRKCRYVSVRDEESAQLLQHIGLPREQLEVVPDPVMGLPLQAGDGLNVNTLSGTDPNIAGGSSKPIIGVSVRIWNENRSELHQLAKSLQLIQAERDVHICFLPFHLPGDIEASQIVIEHMQAAGNVSIAEDLVHPQQMLAAVKACDLLIGMRLHSLIYAASQRVPLIGISYDPKIDQFLHRLDMKAAATTNEFIPEDLAATAIELLTDKGQVDWVESKKASITKLQSEAHRPAQQIVNYLVYRG